MSQEIPSAENGNGTLPFRLINAQNIGDACWLLNEATVL